MYNEAMTAISISKTSCIAYMENNRKFTINLSIRLAIRIRISNRVRISTNDTYGYLRLVRVMVRVRISASVRVGVSIIIR